MSTQNLKIAAVIIGLIAVLIIVPQSNSFVVLLVSRALIFAILAMSLDILLGFTGLASLGQAAYFGLGAYLTAILANTYGFGMKWDFWLMVPLGMIAGGILAAVFGLFAIRATGTYFLMITLALGQCVWGLAYRWNAVTGGDNGLTMRGGRPQFGIDLSNEVNFFYLSFAFFAATLLALYVLVRSPFGKSLLGIRERELRMRILGYNVWLHKYHRLHHRGGFRRAVGRIVGPCQRYHHPGNSGDHDLGRCPADDGARRRRYFDRRRDWRRDRVWAA
jgi:branched-chain amino acid transport system permease protein